MITLQDKGKQLTSRLDVYKNICRSLSNSRSTDSQDQKKGLIRKERAKKLKGSCKKLKDNETNFHKYHFCQHCM